MKTFACALILIVAATPVLALESISEIAECMRARTPDSLQLQQISLERHLRDGGLRKLQGRLYFQREHTPPPGLLQVMVRIDGPPAFAGASYLVRENTMASGDGMYVFLPAVQRVRRVIGELGDSPMFDTDFSYREFRMLVGLISESGLRLEDPEVLDGRPTSVLVVTPPDDSNTRYTLMRFWIDHATCRPLRAEFFEGNNLRKRYTAAAESLRAASNGREYLSLGSMEDLSQGSRTVLRVLKLEFDVPLPPKLFDPESFYLLR